MITWVDIHTNFKTFLEQTLSGSLNVPLHEAEGVSRLDVKSSLPESIWDGSFIIQFNGMSPAQEYIVGVIDNKYSVRVQIAWELNSNDDSTSYVQRVSDLETIVEQRLKVGTFQSQFVNITHKATSGFQFYTNTGNQNFAIVNVDFSTTVRNYDL